LNGSGVDVDTKKSLKRRIENEGGVVIEFKPKDHLSPPPKNLTILSTPLGYRRINFILGSVLGARRLHFTWAERCLERKVWMIFRF